MKRKIPLHRLLTAEFLSTSQWENIFISAFKGRFVPDGIKAILLSLARKGEGEQELAGCVKALRRLEPPTKVPVPFLIDVCGTGGDKKGTFNVSTVTGFVVAAAGGYMAKHGNRAVSSKTGSSDLMEALGVRIDIPFTRMLEALRKFRFGYFHAPFMHPSFSKLQGIRRELGIRTLFNMMGPLVNPVELSFQMVGVANPEWLSPMAKALAAIGRKRAACFRSRDGLDELSTQAPSDLFYIEERKIRRIYLDPRKLGFRGRKKRKDYLGGDFKTNAEIARGVLEGRIDGPCQDIVALNSGLALWLTGIASTLQEGVERSRWILRSGRGLEVLEAFRAYTRARN